MIGKIQRKEKKDYQMQRLLNSIEENKKCYIHDFYTQDELLREAAITELNNKASLVLSFYFSI